MLSRGLARIDVTNMSEIEGLSEMQKDLPSIRDKEREKCVQPKLQTLHSQKRKKGSLVVP